MATFKIRDLMVTLDAAGRGALAPERHRTVAQAHPEVPTGPGAPEYVACGGSPELIVVGRTPGGLIDEAGAEELLLLKKQLEELLRQVERREGTLGQGEPESRERTLRDLKGLERRLAKALAGVRSMIAKRSKAETRTSRKPRARKTARSKA
jgi:hypothetical protein